MSNKAQHGNKEAKKPKKDRTLVPLGVAAGGTPPVTGRLSPPPAKPGKR